MEAQFTPASLAKRLLAIVYDGFALIALYLIGMAILMIPFGQELLPKAITSALILLITWCFYSYFWMKGGQTLGMRAWKLQLQTIDDSKITIKHCLLRLIAAAISFVAVFTESLSLFFIILSSLYLMALFHPEKKSALDIASGTRVAQLDKNPNS